MQESEVLSYPKGKEEAETSKICCVVICRRAFVTPTRQIQKVIFTASMPSSSHALGNTDVSEGGYFWLSVGISCSRSGGLLVISC